MFSRYMALNMKPAPRQTLPVFHEPSDTIDMLNMKKRKRRPSQEVDMEVVPIRMTWDVDAENTSAILEDMGVSMLEEEEDGRESGPNPTPPGTYNHLNNLVPPGAPKVTVLPNPSMNMVIGGYASHRITPLHFMEPQGTSDSSFLFKRARGNVSGGENHWNRLSDEMILSIFKWLPKMVLVRCARVCRRWNRLSFDETLWRRLDLANKTLKPGVVGRIMDRGVAVLRFTKSEILTPLYAELQTAAVFQPRLSKVQYLDLSMATVSPEGLEQLLASCVYLRKLSLENCELSDNVCRLIGQNHNLEVLNLCMCQGITENGLVPICNNLQRLEALNIGWTNLSRGAVVYLVICLPVSLLKLNLSGCRDTLLDEDVQQLCQSCPHVKELDLSDATHITSQAVEFIAGMLRGLEYMALSRCYHIAPAALPMLSNIPTLLALDVFGMLKESALNQLKERLPNIEINKFPFSSIARPTTGIRRTSIWGLRVRDCVV